MDWLPIITTLKLAAITTLLLLLVILPIIYWLQFKKGKITMIVEILISIPLILPPTVLGYYFLVAFNTNNGIGKWLSDTIGLEFIFSFEGLVMASMIYSLPFMVHPILSAIERLPKSWFEASYLIGKSKWRTMWSVILPAIRPSIFSGMVLTFAHTVGEFGIVLMIGGNIPGETRVASIAIFDAMESMDYDLANKYALTLILITASILLPFYLLKSFRNKRIAND